MFSCYSKSMNQTITDTVDLKFRQQNQVKRRTRIPFTKEEDQQLLQLVQYFGINDKNNWYFIAMHMNGRSPRQCRERYQLFLSDRVKKKEKWTKKEDQLLISKYKIYGPHWKQMEQFFDGRTSYNIKNRFISLNRRFKLDIKDEAPNQNFEDIKSTTLEKGISQNTNPILNNEYSSFLNDSDFDFDLDILTLLD